MMPTTKHNTDSLLILFGHLVFVLLCIWSIYYCQARMLAYDSAWQAFYLIQHKDFIIVHDRYLLLFIQALPLLIVKLGGSLQAVLMTYSISWVLFPYVIYLIIVYGLKHPMAGLLLVCALTLTTGATFFYVAAELPLSLAVFSLCVAWLSSAHIKESVRKKKGGEYILFGVGAGLIVLASYGRILIGFAFFWFLFFQILRHAYWREWQWTGLLLFAILWFGLRFLAIANDSYAGSVIQDYVDLFGESPSSLAFSFPQGWLMKLDKGLWISYVITLGLIVYYSWNKHYALASLMLLGLAIYTGIAIKLAPLGVLGSDHYLMIWGGMIAWPLLTELKQIPDKRMSAVVIVIVVLLGIHHFHQHRRHFVKRLTYIESLLQQARQQGAHKAYLLQSDLNRNYMWVDWALGVESLLLSAFDGPDTSISLFSFDGNEKFLPAIEQIDMWLGPHFLDPYPAHRLDSNYFYLPNQAYQKLAF